MTYGATGWLFSPTKAPGWRVGVRSRASRTAGCPLPCCRNAKRGARTLICCGVQPCGSAPMLTAGAEQYASRCRGAGMTSNDPALPDREPDGANHPHPSSNPVTVRIDAPDLPYGTLPLSLLKSSGLCQVDAEATAAVRFARLMESPALVPWRHSRAAAVHSRCHRRVVDAKSWSGIPRWLVPFLREVHEKRRVILVKS